MGDFKNMFGPKGASSDNTHIQNY